MFTRVSLCAAGIIGLSFLFCCQVVYPALDAKVKNVTLAYSVEHEDEVRSLFRSLLVPALSSPGGWSGIKSRCQASMLRSGIGAGVCCYARTSALPQLFHDLACFCVA